MLLANSIKRLKTFLNGIVSAQLLGVMRTETDLDKIGFVEAYSQ